MAEPEPVVTMVLVVTAVSAGHEVYRLTGDRVPLTLNVTLGSPYGDATIEMQVAAKLAEHFQVGHRFDVHLTPVYAVGGPVDPAWITPIGEQS